MSFSPIDDLRLRFNRMVKRRGLNSPTTKRLAQALEQLLTEWYQAMPPQVLSAQTLQAASIPDVAKLKQRYATADAKNDMVTMASLLPLMMQVDRSDPDRPQMLNCCAYAAMNTSSRPIPMLVEVAFEEVVATASPYSRTQFLGLINLSVLYYAGRYFANAKRSPLLQTFTPISIWVFHILHAGWGNRALVTERYFSAPENRSFTRRASMQ